MVIWGWREPGTASEWFASYPFRPFQIRLGLRAILILTRSRACD